jgi:hypothetical protein
MIFPDQAPFEAEPGAEAFSPWRFSSAIEPSTK